jgi:hypothetical protein
MWVLYYKQCYIGETRAAYKLDRTYDHLGHVPTPCEDAVITFNRSTGVNSSHCAGRRCISVAFQ